jgi:hypothetical protein
MPGKIANSCDSYYRHSPAEQREREAMTFTQREV